MASKVKKGFLYYLLWFVFICFGLICIFASILLFNPNKDVFGIGLTYVADRTEFKENRVDVGGEPKKIDSLELTTIKVKSNYSDITIKKSVDYDSLSIVVNKKLSGFSNSKETEYKFNMSYADSTLEINVIEPEFWLALSKSATITIYCPKTLNLANTSLDIETNSGSVSVGISDSEYPIDLASLNVKSNTGAIYTANQATFSSGIVNLNTQESVIDIYSNVTSSLNVTTQNSKLYVKSISGNLVIDSYELSAKCDNIGGNVKYASTKGFITINKLNGNFTASIDEGKTHIANVTINEADGDVTIPVAKASNIVIGKVLGNTKIVTTSGSVSLNNCYGDVDITTDSGEVRINQHQTNAITNIQTYKGKIFANFSELGSSTIKTTEANIEINVSSNKEFKFKYSAGKSISVSWITYTLEPTGEFTFPESSDTTCLIDATSTNGKIVLSNNYVAQ